MSHDPTPPAAAAVVIVEVELRRTNVEASNGLCVSVCWTGKEDGPGDDDAVVGKQTTCTYLVWVNEPRGADGNRTNASVKLSSSRSSRARMRRGEGVAAVRGGNASSSLMSMGGRGAPRQCWFWKAEKALIFSAGWSWRSGRAWSS